MSRPDIAQVNIDRERQRSFLQSQWALLGGSALSVGGLALTGVLRPEIVATAGLFFALVTLTTGAATIAWRRGQLAAGLVLATLHLDSALALGSFYLMGEFETPALGFLSLVIIMAPLYGRRGAEWPVAGVQIVLYLGLVAAREGGGLSWLPYGYMLDPAAVSEPQFLALSVGAFCTVTLGVAFLAGRASLDILTSQQQLRDAVQRQTRELSQINDAVSHDLRAPLQSLISYSEFLEETPLNDEQRELLQELHESAWRMAGMLESLQALSRLSGRLDRADAVPLDRAASAALKNLAAAIAERGVQVEVARPLPRTVGDASLLAEVVQNLLENAIKYSDSEHPRVLLRAVPASEPGRVAFAVEDNGAGVSESDRERIFSPFQRLEQHRGHRGVGTGLAVVERLVAAHGGAVRVERAEELGGARFVVELPAAGAEPALSPPAR